MLTPGNSAASPIQHYRVGGRSEAIAARYCSNRGWQRYAAGGNGLYLGHAFGCLPFLSDVATIYLPPA